MSKVERELRVLRGAVVALSLVVGVLVLTGLRGAPRRYEELNVERINVVEADGRVRLVISNSARFPDGQMNGKTIPRQGGRSPGMLFYNDVGDECGGLIFQGRESDKGRYAGAALLFDQYKQDQTVGIMYEESSRGRTAGLNVWDRPDDPLTDLVERVDRIRAMPSGPDKEAAERRLREDSEQGRLGAQRLFVGKRRDRSAVVSLADRRGNTRIRLMVGAEGEPSLEFLDADGQVISRLPEKP